MDAAIFQEKYGVDMGATYLIRQTRSQAPLHYHFSDGYSYDVIKRTTTDKELGQMAQTILHLSGSDPERIAEVMADLKRLRASLHNPYKVMGLSHGMQCAAAA